MRKIYEKALLKKQINESCKQSSGHKFCSKCKRSGHLADKCYEGRVLTTSVSVETCPVCDGDLHQLEYKASDGSKRQVTSTRITTCDIYNKANDEEKRAIFLRVKGKTNKLCTICTSWRHDSSEYRGNFKCKFCNNKHHFGACALQKLVSCANVGNKFS